MQTFLPYESFARSAEVLDHRRLGKQRVEVIQIVRALTVPTYAWKSHPAVLMWQGFEEALGRYGMEMVRVWCGRGFDDTCEGTILRDLATAGVRAPRSQAELAADSALPPWLGDPAFHRSHQSSLLRKDPEWYAEHFPDVPADLPYVWPVRSPKVLAAEQRRADRRASRPTG
ncbi:MAG: MSMEG_6728 family protein [Acidimicrobiales bacterium]